MGFFCFDVYSLKSYSFQAPFQCETEKRIDTKANKNEPLQTTILTLQWKYRSVHTIPTCPTITQLLVS